MRCNVDDRVYASNLFGFELEVYGADEEPQPEMELIGYVVAVSPRDCEWSLVNVFEDAAVGRALRAAIRRLIEKYLPVA